MCAKSLTHGFQVIKALSDYTPDPNDKEKLAFRKGDFFYVISREDDPYWYEACNPKARGLVPVKFFEVIDKTERQSAVSLLSVGAKEGRESGFSNRDPRPNMSETTTNTTRNAANARTSASIGKDSGALVFGSVLYDFNSERPDELEAKAGENIIVVAQTDPEWFVAKPIGRLGGPGLIPVSFIEIKDMATGQPVSDPVEAVKKAGVPTVEYWKEMAAEYKKSSISLGRLDASQQVTSEMGISPGSAQTPYSQLPYVSCEYVTILDVVRPLIGIFPSYRLPITPHQTHLVHQQASITDSRRSCREWLLCPDFVSTTIIIGMSSNAKWRMVKIGNCGENIGISMISK